MQPVAHKREEYAARLRKQKVQEKLREKRARADLPPPSDLQQLEARLAQLDPELVNPAVSSVPTMMPTPE